MNEEEDNLSNEAETQENPRPVSDENTGATAGEESSFAEEGTGRKKKRSLDFLNNVPMKLTVELGMGDISIRDLLQLGQGSILELEKLAGEPLEVKVNDRLISKGEVVVINERYGIRLTDVISEADLST